jgi:hypothetical protein
MHFFTDEQLVHTYTSIKNIAVHKTFCPQGSLTLSGYPAMKESSMNNMNAPKILPWIARKAGISDELALKLWRRAVSEAEYLTGKAEGSNYWGLAVERFLAIVEDEVGNAPAYSLTPAPQLSWMWRHQTRMSLLSLMAAQNAYKCWQNTWSNVYGRKRAA